MKTYGYARISTGKQNIERQVSNILNEYPDAVIFKEVYTGTTTDRPEWNKLLKVIKSGDRIVFDEVSRMSRDAAEGYALYQDLFGKGIDLVFLKERYIDTAVYVKNLQQACDTKTGKGYLDDGLKIILLGIAKEQIEIAFAQAEKEIENLHRRTSEGVRRAQAEGKQVGRKDGAVIDTKKAKKMRELIRKISKEFDGAASDSECIEMTGLARNTFYKYKKQIREGM